VKEKVSLNIQNVNPFRTHRKATDYNRGSRHVGCVAARDTVLYSGGRKFIKSPKSRKFAVSPSPSKGLFSCVFLLLFQLLIKREIISAFQRTICVLVNKYFLINETQKYNYFYPKIHEIFHTRKISEILDCILHITN
jgi:hypothetical protein